jgi:hypothetical protein
MATMAVTEEIMATRMATSRMAITRTMAILAILATWAASATSVKTSAKLTPAVSHYVGTPKKLDSSNLTTPTERRITSTRARQRYGRMYTFSWTPSNSIRHKDERLSFVLISNPASAASPKDGMRRNSRRLRDWRSVTLRRE